MADIDFFISPFCNFWEKCTKEQLLKIADRYEIVISDKRLKENIKVIKDEFDWKRHFENGRVCTGCVFIAN